MINPIPFLSLFNASLSTFPSRNLSPSTSETVDCFDPDHSGKTQLSPVIYKDCREAIASIPVGEKGLAPITWARDPDAGFEVPAYWQHGNCVVGVDVTGEDVRETEVFARVLRAAFGLAVTCVIQPPHLGGKALLGQNKELEVYLYGYKIGTKTHSTP